MAGYDVYIGDVLLPVAPQAITTSINGRNKVYDLINEGEMNILKLAGLTTVSFTVLLPAVQYPFAVYRNGFLKPSYFLELFEKLKQGKQGFQFIVSRYDSNSVRRNLYNTNMTVSMEDYKIKEDAKGQGFDIEVEITLKQFKQYTTKTFTVVTPSPTAPVAVTPVRPQSTSTTTAAKTGSGGGTKSKKYKVQIPGMSVLEVTATSIQDAITKAGAVNWTGTIYVDGTAYYVNKGKLAVDPNKTKAAINSTISSTISTIAQKAVETAKKTVVTPAMITGATKTAASTSIKSAATSAINAILNKNVLSTNSVSSTIKKPASTSSGGVTTSTVTKPNSKAMVMKN